MYDKYIYIIHNSNILIYLTSCNLVYKPYFISFHRRDFWQKIDEQYLAKELMQYLAVSGSIWQMQCKCIMLMLHILFFHIQALNSYSTSENLQC